MTRDSRRGGRKSSWFQTLRAISAEIARTFEPLRAFHIEAWTTSSIVALWLALSALDRGFAASDPVLLCVVGAIGCLVGGRLGELRSWPATVLVPRYGQSLFLLCLATVGSATALCALWSWWLGNPFPAIGPALLVAVAATLGAMRVPVAIVVTMVLPFAVLFMLVLVFAISFDLSEVWFQLGALAGGGLISFRLRRSLTLSPTRLREVRQPAVAFGRFPTEELKIGVATIGGALLLLVPSWYLGPWMLESFFVLMWFLSLGNILLSWRFMVHVQLSREWTFGIAANRKDLGRRAAVRGVWVSLPWLVLGTLVALIHSFVKSPEEGLLFDEVLVIQSVAVAFIAALCSMSQVPPSQLSRFFVAVLGLGSMGAA
ncbi:MAG: hypothetical protein OXP36_06790, partial [Gammaproteobacteria bacterium]|nr:hypothetical protein [Gammaproteobacteria bacterium]